MLAKHKTCEGLKVCTRLRWSREQVRLEVDTSAQPIRNPRYARRMRNSQLTSSGFVISHPQAAQDARVARSTKRKRTVAERAAGITGGPSSLSDADNGVPADTPETRAALLASLDPLPRTAPARSRLLVTDLRNHLAARGLATSRSSAAG